MQNALNKVISAALTFAGVASVASSSFYVVPAGHKAVVLDRLQGVLPDSKNEGLNFKIPLVQYPFLYEVRTKFKNIQSTTTSSKDLQTVLLSLRILYRPDSKKLQEIHTKLGPEYANRVLPGIANELLKDVIAQYDAGELITQRELVSHQIGDVLTQRAKEFNILVEDVALTDISFGPEFTAAIEAKQVAQQEAERSKFMVMKAEQMTKAAIIQAEGEAEAARLIIDAMKTGPAFIELRKIDAAREIAETLTKSPNVHYVPQGGNVLLNTGGRRLNSNQS